MGKLDDVKQQLLTRLDNPKEHLSRDALSGDAAHDK
jgi:hypothetical protein